MPRKKVGAVGTAFGSAKRKRGRKKGTVAKPKTKAARQKAFVGR